MRTLLIAVTLVAGCATAPARDKHAERAWRGWPTRSEAPRDSIEKERTGETQARTPASMPPQDQPVGPVRDIQPVQ